MRILIKKAKVDKKIVYFFSIYLFCKYVYFYILESIVCGKTGQGLDILKLAK